MYRHYTTIALIMCLTSACTTAPSAGGAQNDGSVTAGHDTQPQCRQAINDVTRYCEGEELNRRRCNNAKEASRKECI